MIYLPTCLPARLALLGASLHVCLCVCVRTCLCEYLPTCLMLASERMDGWVSERFVVPYVCLLLGLLGLLSLCSAVYVCVSLFVPVCKLPSFLVPTYQPHLTNRSECGTHAHTRGHTNGRTDGRTHTHPSHRTSPMHIC